MKTQVDILGFDSEGSEGLGRRPSLLGLRAEKLQHGRQMRHANHEPLAIEDVPRTWQGAACGGWR